MAQPEVAMPVNQPLSNLLPYGALILCSSILGIVVISNVLERWLFQMAYGKIWLALLYRENERRRRSFTYLHVGVIIMLSLVLVGAYPAFDFLVGRGDLSVTLAREGGIRITIGDILYTLSQIYSAYYLFELCFRTAFASVISIMHHIGLLIIVQTALALFANLQRHPEATMEFYMCMVWGMALYICLYTWRCE
jgi:hypothetical protein